MEGVRGLSHQVILAQLHVGLRGRQQWPRGLENWKCALRVVPLYPFLCEAMATSVACNPPVLPGRRDFTGLGSVVRKRKAGDCGWTFQLTKGQENCSYFIDSKMGALVFTRHKGVSNYTPPFLE